jgi:hypothetical protein
LVGVKLLIELDFLNRTYMLNWLVSLRQLLASVPAAVHNISLCINENLDLRPDVRHETSLSLKRQRLYFLIFLLVEDGCKVGVEIL